MALVLHTGTYYSFGVFFKPMQAELGWSRADISWSIFINQAVHGAGYVIVGSLVDRHDPRKVIPGFAACLLVGYVAASRAAELWQLYLSYGVVAGIGLGLGYGSLAGVVARWFETRRGFALGVASSGAAIGTIVMPPAISQLILATGWRFTMSMLGFLLFGVFLVVAFVVKRGPDEKGLLPYGATTESRLNKKDAESAQKQLTNDVTLREAVKGRALWVVIASFAAYAFGQQMVMFHVVNHATDAGLEPTVAAGILSLIGIGGLAGRLVMGALADKFGPIRLLRVSMLATAAALPTLIPLSEASGFMMFGLVFGLFYGGIVPLQAATVQYLFGSRSMGSVFGFVVFMLVMIGGLGPLSAGYVFDATQSYSVAFVCAAVLCVLAAAITLRLRTARSKDTPDAAGAGSDQ